MVIQLKVFEQTLSIIDTKSVPRKGSKDYLVLQFTFSSDWKDLNKVCYLQCDEVSQPIEVVDGLVEVPEWFTEQDSFNITLLGTNGSQEVPTNVVYLHLQKSNTLWEKDAPEPQPSWLAKVIDLNNHPPIPGDNGCWLLWNTDSGAYVESELPLPDMPVGPSGGSVPKPLTFDYMPEGYPTKSVQTTTLMKEQQVAFALNEEEGLYVAQITPAFEVVEGQTYTVNWDGTEYKCVGFVNNPLSGLGNLSIAGMGDDTGEPFLLAVNDGLIVTADTSASHTISISNYIESIVKINPKYLPMASETEPGMIALGDLDKFVLDLVKEEYFHIIEFQISGYGDAQTIEKCANRNNSYGIIIPGKLSGAVLSCYDNVANKYITFVLSGSDHINCYKFSMGSFNAEQLWGISKDGVVISSSTPNSTKKFRITVDDTGTLKATEVK